VPTRGKPRCITLIFENHFVHIYIYMLCIYVSGVVMKTTCINTLPMSPTSTGSCSCYA
jgi:hypothetical protein